MSAPASQQRRSGSDLSSRYPVNIPLTQRFLNWIHRPELGGCFELRAPHARVHYRTNAIVAADSIHATVGGWYDNVSESRHDLSRVEGVSIYACYNPIDVALCGRRKNSLGVVTKATKDDHIIKWIRFYLDFDSYRIEGISATDDELSRARDQFHVMLDSEPELTAATHWGCSGNGCWGGVDFVGLDLAVAEPLVERALLYLAARYSLPGVATLEPKCKNASRIGALPGTWKCKGEDLVGERPWRQITMDSPDEPRTPLSLPDWLADRHVPEVTPGGRVRPQRGHGAVPALPLTDPSPNGKNRHTDDPLPLPSPPSGALPDTDVQRSIDLATEDRSLVMRRAWGCVKKIPFAVAGKSVSGVPNKHGHAQTYDVACVLVRGFGLTVEESGPIFDWYCSRCKPPWGPGQRAHKLAEADDGDDTDDKGEVKPRGYKLDERGAKLPDINDQRDQVYEAPDGTEIGVKVDQPIRQDALDVTPGYNQKLINDIVSSYLYKCRNLYQRGYMLVSVVQEDLAGNIKWLSVPPGTPTVASLTKNNLSEVISSLVRFKRKGEVKFRPADPPAHCIGAVLDRRSWSGVPHLIGVSEFPIIRPDGSITSRPGYDPETGILWVGEEIPPVLDHPSQDDARMAADQLLELVCEFEFEDDSSKATWLSCLLTIMCRHMIDDFAPLFYFDANTAGSGKSLLCDLISCVVSGRSMVRMGYSHDPVEMDKRLLSILMKGIRVTMMDNVEGDFGNSALDSVLTAQYYSGRILGKTDMTADLLVNTVFAATANNAVLCGDLYRRISRCRLVSSYERPDQDRTGFKFGDVRLHAKSNRGNLMSSALTIMRAYIQAGCPHDFPTNVYGGWTKLIRGGVVWATGLDPWKNRAEIIGSDTRRSNNHSLLDGLLAMQLELGKTEMTSAKILQELGMPYGAETYPVLHEAVMEIWNCHSGQVPAVKALSKRLASMIKTRYGDLRLTRRTDSHSKVDHWAVEQLISRTSLDQTPPF